MSQELWISPLLLLPGVALLVMSTSARYGQIHAEVHNLMDHGKDLQLARHLMHRSSLFRNALVALYVAVACLSLSSFLGGITLLMSAELVAPVVFTLTCAGICALVFAAVTLIRESVLSLDIIRQHVAEMERERQFAEGEEKKCQLP